MKALITAALLTTLPALALAQSQVPSDRYTPSQPQAGMQQNDQQAQTPEEKRSGEIEDLRRNNMSSPNVTGERVQDNPETGVPEIRDNRQRQREEGGTRP